MKQCVYFISGLGADERVFSKLHLPNCKVIHLSWFDPERGETMESYAQKMSKKIVEEDAIVIGLSMGGMIAIEIAKIKKLKKVILISSCKTRKEFPVYIRLAAALRIPKLFIRPSLNLGKAIFCRLIGAKSKDDISLVKNLLEDASPNFVLWAVRTLPFWKNEIIPPNVYHIHGTKDYVLPFKYIKCDYAIKGGGHIMVYNRAEECERIIGQVSKIV